MHVLIHNQVLLILLCVFLQFHDTPLHRAAVLQSVNVIPILIKYRVKLSSRDKVRLFLLFAYTWLLLATT